MAADQSIEFQLASLTKYLLALLTGAIILFPTISGALKPPYIWDAALYVFWGAAILGVAALAIAFYLSNFVGAAPHRSAGLGTLLTTIALIALASYVGANLVSDRTSPPRLTEVLAEPKVAFPEQWVKLSAVATDEDEDSLNWSWSVGSQATSATTLAQKRIAYWRVPSSASAGDYVATVEVKDDSDVSQTGAVTITIEEKPTMETMSEKEQIRAYISNRVRLHSAKIIRSDPKKKDLVNSAREKLVDSAVDNIDSLDAIRDDPQSVTEAMDEYFAISQPELQQADFRPCCKKYPGIWPFCNRSC